MQDLQGEEILDGCITQSGFSVSPKILFCRSYSFIYIHIIDSIIWYVLFLDRYWYVMERATLYKYFIAWT